MSFSYPQGIISLFPFEAKVPQLSLRKPNYHWVARDRQWAEKTETWHSSGLLYRKGSHPLQRWPALGTHAPALLLCAAALVPYTAAQAPFTALGSAATPTTQRLRLRNERNSWLGQPNSFKGMEINAFDVRINVGKERKVGSEERFWPELKGPGRGCTLDRGFGLSSSDLALPVPLPGLPHQQATSWP